MSEILLEVEAELREVVRLIESGLKDGDAAKFADAATAIEDAAQKLFLRTVQDSIAGSMLVEAVAVEYQLAGQEGTQGSLWLYTDPSHADQRFELIKQSFELEDVQGVVVRRYTVALDADDPFRKDGKDDRPN